MILGAPRQVPERVFRPNQCYSLHTAEICHPSSKQNATPYRKKNVITHHSKRPAGDGKIKAIYGKANVYMGRGGVDILMQYYVALLPIMPWNSFGLDERPPAAPPPPASVRSLPGRTGFKGRNYKDRTRIICFG